MSSRIVLSETCKLEIAYVIFMIRSDGVFLLNTLKRKKLFNIFQEKNTDYVPQSRLFVYNSKNLRVDKF